MHADTSGRAVSRRDTMRIALYGGLSAGLLGVGEGCSKPQSGEVDVTAFRRNGERDEGAAFTRALATGRPVFVPTGEYRASMVRLPPGARIRGQGAASVVRAAEPDAYAIFYADSGSSDAVVSGIDIRDLSLVGDVGTRGFREHSHLLALQGVRAVAIENVGFIGFRGDGLMLEGADALAPDPVKAPRHNRDVAVRRCLFDGVNRDNRNGISIVDGHNVTIHACRFRNTTRADMPGAIDIEPNPYSFDRIADITVDGCEFVGIGGNVGAIALYVPTEVLAPAVRLRFVNNRMDDYKGTGADYAIRCANATVAATNDIRVSGHVGHRGQRPFSILAANGVTIDNSCRFSSYRSAALIGYAEGRDVVRDVAVAGRYERVGFGGKPNQFGLAVFVADGLTIAGDWIDCGDGSADSAGVIFLQGGSRRVDLTGLRVRASGRSAANGVLVAGSHRLDRATSRLSSLPGSLPVRIEP